MESKAATRVIGSGDAVYILKDRAESEKIKAAEPWTMQWLLDLRRERRGGWLGSRGGQRKRFFRLSPRMTPTVTKCGESGGIKGGAGFRNQQFVYSIVC